MNTMNPCTAFTGSNTRCGAPAAYRVFWPGQTPPLDMWSLDMCFDHATSALRLPTPAGVTVKVLTPNDTA